jgi:hypothetical protein
MTNRARPTWPEGAADNPQSARSAQGGTQSTGPATPASNGRSGAASSGNGQPRTTGNGQRPDLRQQPRPGSTPVRPQQPRPGAAPSTPGRPEPWSPTHTPVPPAGGPSVAPSYGQTEAKTETFGDRVSAARQAVLDKAAAVTSSRPEKSDRTEARLASRAEKEPKSSSRSQTRKARLRMSRIDPWSVMKTSFLLAIAFGIVTWVAVFIIWSAIGAAGVFDNINSTVQEVLGTPTAEPFRIENYINTGKVMGFTTLLACADVLIITALATLGSFLYNIAATLLGGLEVTLASED